MRYLLDSGILLRIVNRTDQRHDQTRLAVRILKEMGHSTVTSAQNIAEFWNVCTRPAAARGGLGLTHEVAAFRLRLIERITSVLLEPRDTYSHWKAIVLTLRVQGVQVHDARIAALCSALNISKLLTWNSADFRRYSHLDAQTPGDIIALADADLLRRIQQ
jgi:predicted nucleic acid-binding protein